jgi:hypothetical protein
MTQSTEHQSTSPGPEGSIFLPKTPFPDREFESWEFQLLTGRGIAAGKEYEDIQIMADELREVRSRHIGSEAINAI